MYWKQFGGRWLLGVALTVAATGSAGADAGDDQFAMAASHYTRGRWPQATEEFEKLLHEFPAHTRAGDAQFFLAEATLQTGQYDLAKHHYTEFLDRFASHSHRGQALFRLGEIAYLVQDRQGAARQLEEFRQQHPNDALDAYALAYLGEIALATQQFARASEIFREALERFGESDVAEQCRFGLGRVLETTGDREGATRLYQLLIEQSEKGLADDAQLQLGVMYFNNGQFHDAIDAFGVFAVKFPQSALSATAAYWQGMSHLKLKQWDNAAANFALAASKTRDDNLAPAILYYWSESMRNNGNREKAVELYSRLSDEWPTSQWADDAFHERMKIAFQDQDDDRVITLARMFEERCAESPLAANVQQLHGRALLRQKNYVTAIAVFQKLVPDGDAAATNLENTTANGNTEVNRYYLGLAHLGANQYDEADRVLCQVDLSRTPDTVSAGVYAARASLLMSSEKYTAAVDVIRGYVSSFPDRPEAERLHNRLVVALIKSGRLEEALGEHARLAGRRGDEASFVWTTLQLAEAMYASADYEAAQRLYSQVLAADPKPAHESKALSGLGWTFSKRWMWPAARDAFALHVDRFPRGSLASESLFMLATAEENAGQASTALRDYYHLVHQFDDSPHAAKSLQAAIHLHQARGELREAVTLAERLVNEFPEFPQLDSVLYQLAWDLNDLGEQDAADRIFARIFALHRDSPFWADATYRLAERAARQSDRKQAFQFLDSLIASDSNEELLTYGLFLRGQLAANAQDWPAVCDTMQRIVTEFPNCGLRAAAVFWLAESLFRLAEYDAALTHFQSLNATQRQNSEPWMAMVPVRCGQIFARQKKWTEAYEIARTARERFPSFEGDFELDYLLGRCHLSRAEMSLARTAFQQVIDSPQGGPTETAAMAQWMIGESYFLQKEYDEAIKAYHRVEVLFDYPRWQAAAVVQAGKCHELAGRPNEAAKLYQQVIAEYGQTSYAEQAKRRLNARRR